MPRLLAVFVFLAGAVLLFSGATPAEHTRLRWLELLYPPTTATYLSIAALVVGSLLFFARAWYRKGTAFVDSIGPLLPERVYDACVAGMLGLAELTTRVLQNGSLQSYVRVMVGVTFAIAAFAYARAGFDGALDVAVREARPSGQEAAAVV